MARPGGSFNKPKVATGKKPKFKTNTGASYNGTRGTKTPTGSRPTPSVAKDGHPTSTKPGPVRKAVKETKMPATSMKSGRRKHGSY